jgi:plastocyanin
MHTVALHLAPILGAEKSKVPFYVCGGLLVAWALILSVGIGLRRPEFPGHRGGERVVMAITAVLVIAAASAAVITSGGSTTAGASSAGSGSSAAAPQAPASEESTTAAAPRSPSAPQSSPARTSPSAPLKLAANPAGELSYDTKQLSAKAGMVTMDFSNSSPLPHNVVIAQGSKIFGQTPIKTGSSTLKLNLKPGSYTFYCAVPGHRQAGMEGTLTVS